MAGSQLTQCLSFIFPDRQVHHQAVLMDMSDMMASTERMVALTENVNHSEQTFAFSSFSSLCQTLALCVQNQQILVCVWAGAGVSKNKLNNQGKQTPLQEVLLCNGGYFARILYLMKAAAKIAACPLIQHCFSGIASLSLILHFLLVYAV